MYLKLVSEDFKDIKNSINKPFYVYLSLSNMCNANCVFCDVRLNKLKTCNLDVYRILNDLKKLGTKYIHFTGGGEPFINDDIFNYIDYASNLGFKINVITNGYNLNEEKIKRLSKYNIVNMFFSLDSCKSNIHDELRGIDGLFERTTNNINLVHKYLKNTKIIINHVINTKNIDDFGNFIIMKDKVYYDILNPIIIKDCDLLFPTNKQIEKFRNNKDGYYNLALKNNIEFLSNIDFFDSNVCDNGDCFKNNDLKCIFANYCMFIDGPSGLVYPCDCSIHRDRTMYCIGDLNKDSVIDIWKGDKRKILSNLLIKGTLDCKLKCDQANCLFNNKYFEEEN